MNKTFFKQILFVFALSFASLQAMDRDALLCMVQPISAEPIRQVPAYLLANPFQGSSFSWDAQKLDRLLGQAEAATVKKLQRSFRDSRKVEKNAVTLDWLHCLSMLQNQFLSSDRLISPEISSELMVRVNAACSRLTLGSGAGSYRAAQTGWPKTGLTQSEEIVYQLLEREDSSCLYVTGEELYNMLAGLRKCGSGTFRDRWVMPAPGANYTREFNPDEVRGWLAELGLNRNELHSQININEWLSLRTVLFPHPALIPQLLRQACNEVSSINHPIERAMRLWWQEVKTHPFQEANKRTGRAVASIVLLENGYLPPEIGPGDEQQFLDVFTHCLDGEEGFTSFLSYMVGLIERAQDKYGSDLSRSPLTQAAA